jgi:hypothetical protein
MGRVRVVDTKAGAQKTFKVFHDRTHRKELPFEFGWPASMQEVGEGKAEMYRSNKWQKNLQQYEEYKHVVEGTRTVYMEPGFLREWGNPRKAIELCGPMVAFEEPMPKHFARLGPLLGLQVRLYRCDDGEPYLPDGDGEDGNLYEITVARAYLGGAEHPSTGERFLFVYDARGVHIVLTGGELGIEKDGIVG